MADEPQQSTTLRRLSWFIVITNALAMVLVAVVLTAARPLILKQFEQLPAAPPPYVRLILALPGPVMIALGVLLAGAVVAKEFLLARGVVRWIVNLAVTALVAVVAVAYISVLLAPLGSLYEDLLR